MQQLAGELGPLAAKSLRGPSESNHVAATQLGPHVPASYNLAVPATLRHGTALTPDLPHCSQGKSAEPFVLA